MAAPGISPVARFSPVSGLFVDRTEKTVTISGKMEMFGPEATASRASSARHSINTVWTASFPDGHSVRCKIDITYRPPGTAAGDFCQIEAIKIAGPSHVSGIDRSMTLNANEADAFTWTAAHEFGHVIGLQDRYAEGIMSKLVGTFGGTRKTTVDPRYQQNLMAVSNGSLESQNISDVASENQPSSYWINDDDYVRNWVDHHVLAEVTALSGANKVSMIATLMGGWISEEDVRTIVRICSAVDNRVEAEAIRAAVDTTTFQNFGHRTRVRIALLQMP